MERATSAAGTSSSPCGACKFLRRKCATDCIFAPYFCSEQGPARFAAIHKVFGASNVSKLLLHIPVADRCEAVVTIAYEAQARIRDPVYGCVAHIFALQQQVACLQAQLMQVKSQMAQSLIDSRNAQNQWPTAGNYMAGMPPTSSLAYINPSNYNYMNSSVSPQSSLESNIDHQNNDGMNMQETHSKDDQLFSFQAANYSSSSSSSSNYKKRPASQTDLNELQALAFRMMNN